MLVLCGDSEKCVWYVAVYKKNETVYSKNINLKYQKYLRLYGQVSERFLEEGKESNFT